MTKKIKTLFKDKKKRTIKEKKRSHNKAEKKVDNLIPFINKSAKSGKIQTEECERTRIDTLAKELIDSFAKSINRSFLNVGDCWSIFIFRTLQTMIFYLSYPVYRYFLNSASEQVTRNHKEWLSSFKEWETAKPKDEILGEKKKDNENDTIH